MGIYPMPKLVWGSLRLPEPPKEAKRMAQYPKIERIGSIGSILLAIVEVQVAAADVMPGAASMLKFGGEDVGSICNLCGREPENSSKCQVLKYRGLRSQVLYSYHGIWDLIP